MEAAPSTPANVMQTPAVFPTPVPFGEAVVPNSKKKTGLIVVLIIGILALLAIGYGIYQATLAPAPYVPTGGIVDTTAICTAAVFENPAMNVPKPEKYQEFDLPNEPIAIKATSTDSFDKVMISVLNKDHVVGKTIQPVCVAGAAGSEGGKSIGGCPGGSIPLSFTFTTPALPTTYTANLTPSMVFVADTFNAGAIATNVEFRVQFHGVSFAANQYSDIDSKCSVSAKYTSRATIIVPSADPATPTPTVSAVATLPPATTAPGATNTPVASTAPVSAPAALPKTDAASDRRAITFMAIILMIGTYIASMLGWFKKMTFALTAANTFDSEKNKGLVKLNNKSLSKSSKENLRKLS